MVADGGDGQAPTRPITPVSGTSPTIFLQAVINYLKKCGTKHTVTNNGRSQAVANEGCKANNNGICKRDWGEKYPPSIGLIHKEPPHCAVSRFITNMLACDDTVLKSEYIGPGTNNVKTPYINENLTRFGWNKTAQLTVVSCRKWVNHYKLILAVASGQDIKDELIPAADLSSSVMRCIQRALQQKDDAMYYGWLDRFRGIFDPKFVVSAPLC